MNIRPLTPEDLPSLLPMKADIQNLHAAWLPDRYVRVEDPNALLAFANDQLAADGTIALGAEIDGAVRGYAIAVVAEAAPHPLLVAGVVASLNEICVDDAYQRRGIADALVTAIKREAKARGATRINASHAVQNEASAALMRKHGLMPAMIRCEGRL